MQSPFYDYKKCLLQISLQTKMAWPPHFHQYIEIVYVMSGSTWMEYWDKNRSQQMMEVKQGEMAFFMPYVIHAYPDRETPGTEYMIINFNPEVAMFNDHVFINSYIDSPLIPASSIHEDILYIFKKFLREDIVKNDTRIIGLYLNLISERLSPLFSYRPEAIVDRQREKGTSIISYVNSHYDSDITLNTVSKDLGINVYTLSRFFSQIMGISFRDYINNFRINKAQHMLLTTNMSIIDIQLECGFGSQQTFIRVFYTATGMTPYRYRNSHEKINDGHFEDSSNAILYFDDRDKTHRKYCSSVDC
jgi:AraC-like DNA-binding protein